MARYRRRFRGRRRFRSFRRGGRRGGMSIMKFGAGAVIGFMAPNMHQYQDLAITLFAIAPIPKFGLGAVARGYVLGRIVKNMGLLGGTPNTGGMEYV